MQILRKTLLLFSYIKKIYLLITKNILENITLVMLISIKKLNINIVSKIV